MVVRRAVGMSSLAEAEDRSLLHDSKFILSMHENKICARPVNKVHVVYKCKVWA